MTWNVRIGINPISWSNDDLPALGGETSLETALREGAEIGYEGFELGNKFPQEPAALKAKLAEFGVACVSGWYSGRLAEGSLDDEMARCEAHMRKLQLNDCRVVVYGEVAGSIQGQIDTPLYKRPRLTGDAQWKALTAMDHYYENGPLPSWIGWYVQQELPHWFHAGAVVLTFLVELCLVWMALMPRRFRLACFFIVSPFQVAIILTANYAFLNYIVLALGVLLLDDAFLARARLKAPPTEPRKPGWTQRVILGLIFYCTVVLAPGLSHTLPRPLLWPAIALEPLRIANRYGLFAVMTTDRYEIEFQGSPDGQRWTPYPYRYKPQDPMRAPGIHAPYQPRFEWNLWFASLGEWRGYPWVVRTELRLLEGSPEVLRLFAADPFAGKPPEYVRAVKWQYWFTTPHEKRATGAWWRRELLGLYAPVLRRTASGFEPVEMP